MNSALDFGMESKHFGNRINVKNSLVSFLNQNTNHFVEAMNLPSIDQHCLQRKRFPMLGIIDIRNDIGLRKAMSLEWAQQELSIDMGSI